MIQIGKLFAGRYRILQSIGRGGMADVYLANDLILDNEEVAIKVLRTNYQTDQVAVTRFQREARAMSELNHPNIVAIRDIGEEDGQQFLAMEYVDGADLKKYIQDHAPLSNAEVIRIMKEVLSAMTLAHQKGIIHRDLKPQNVLLTKDGTAKVTDFGIAVAFAETSLTQTNSMLGSVHYLSPEQARGSKATVQSDIYAMGIMLFEMLTGHIPYDGDSAVTIALQHFQKPLPSIISENKNVPQALENVVIKATAKRLTDRYTSTEEMLQDLKTCLQPNRSRERKLIFNDPSDTKPLPKLEQSMTSSTSAQALKDKAASKAASKEPKAKPKKKRGLLSRLLKLFFILVVLGIAVLAYMILTKPSTISVPNVSGYKLSSAKSKIVQAGLKVGQVRRIEDDSVDAGKVVRTNPSAGSKKREGSSVDIFVSGTNSFVMENYIGQNYQSAIDNLTNTHGVPRDNIRIKEVSSDEYGGGTVIEQSPKSGKTFTPDSGKKITLKVVKVTMPNLKNSTYEEAVATLKALGIASSRIKVYDGKDYSTKISSPSASSVVVGQRPYYGNTISLTSDDDIILYVSDAVDTNTHTRAPSSSEEESTENTTTNNATTSNENTSEASSPNDS
ncbi:Stk1 family PASTA domain-containing Ser/Thr kinase [Streptococcus macacae]|uniref:Serine/threonine-protein kinase StkP n=1 Tax=Streptococcus macacae NCTC 11558 TaxID=764298 RepID=G5JY28_9STRE|nr:Stk1 family PASTA domain-containing Ser/Thr kinase [Streptococcus macacae]EHJ51682.1 kinase domain protein [Streptococcus macacae NCTC 11558]SUN77946.1 serine /threonine protein kinase [Streptococcus macacae NCTC 11558]